MKVDKSELYHSARELFMAKGFKNTSIADITGRAGISVGSFYTFYKSKEAVFLDVFIAESNSLNERVVREVDLDGDPVYVIKEIIFKLFAGAQENRVLREWFNRDVYRKLEKYLQQQGRPETPEYDFSNELFTRIIDAWQNEGKIRRDMDSSLILAMLNSFQYIDLHQGEIGSEHFPLLLERMIEFVVRGLMSEA